MERDIKPTYDELESYVENLQKQLADAQATIAALEETILKMGENAAVVAKDAMAAKEQVAALQGQVRTATQLIIAEIGASGPEDLEEAIGRIVARLTQRTAALARVRKKLGETKLYLQQERANRDSLVACVNRDVKTIKELRTLILALPKVEGEVAVKRTEVDLSYVWGITLNGYFTFQSALFDGKEEAESYAAILKHRQGMEA